MMIEDGDPVFVVLFDNGGGRLECDSVFASMEGVEEYIADDMEEYKTVREEYIVKMVYIQV